MALLGTEPGGGGAVLRPEVTSHCGLDGPGGPRADNRKRPGDMTTAQKAIAVSWVAMLAAAAIGVRLEPVLGVVAAVLVERVVRAPYVDEKAMMSAFYGQYRGLCLGALALAAGAATWAAYTSAVEGNAQPGYDAAASNPYIIVPAAVAVTALIAYEAWLFRRAGS